MEQQAFQIEKDLEKNQINVPSPTDKGLGYLKNDSLTSVDIQEMERVRSSLQSMLKSSEPLLRDEDSGDIRNETMRDQDSFSTLSTAALLNNFVNADNKEVATVSDTTASDEHNEFVRQSRNKYDRSLLTENSLLNQSLEKERFKRRHCEQQIKDLQSKLLQTQQELAVSVSGERKKDVMINRLDKTLARVVEDWKKHEQGKLDAVRKLEERREQDEQSQQRQQEMLTQFEKDLAQAVEALSKEQERAASAELEKDSQIAAVLEERNQLLHLLAKEREKTTLLERQVQDLDQKANKAEKLKRVLDKEQQAWEEERKELESKIQFITQSHAEDLENEKKLVDHEKQVAEDSQRVLAAVQKEVQKLTVQLDTCNREKENLKTEITLLAAKFEAQKARQDSEHQAELERQLSKNLREVQNQLSKSENEMRTTHKKQIEELTRKYKNDLEEQLRTFHQQLKERDRKLKETNEEYEGKLSVSHNQLLKISNEREALRNEKHKMVVRLQKMMQSHCEEALSLLVANTANIGGGKVFDSHDHDATWMTRQTPVLVTSASHVGIPRAPPQGVPSFVSASHHSDVINSSGISNTSKNQAQFSSESWMSTQKVAQIADDSGHTWIKLSPVTEGPVQTKHATYSDIHATTKPREHSYTQTYSDGVRLGVGEDRYDLNVRPNPREEINVEYPTRPTRRNSDRHESGIKEGSYTDLSPSTTNESLTEQTADEDHESEMPNLPLNLSSDVLKMLQQQQSRQTELNHYVQQLLKKSPSSGSGGELTDLATPNMASFSVRNGMFETSTVNSL